MSFHVANIGDVAVVECEGRIVQTDAVFKLREAVTAQTDTHFVVLDLSEVCAIEGAGVGTLMFLQRWAQDRGIRFKLFNPSGAVRNQLEHVSSKSDFDIVSLDEIMALLARADRRHALAA